MSRRGFISAMLIGSCAAVSLQGDPVDTRLREGEAPHAPVHVPAAIPNRTITQVTFDKTLVTECRNSDTSAVKSPEACVWWSRSKKETLDKLVIYFAGGDQGCSLRGLQADGWHGYGALAQAYVDDNYIFVCANLFQRPLTRWASKIPFVDEAARVDLVIKSVTKTLKDRWTGKHLLISGISHGATAPVIAMKHTAFEENPAWHGTQTTAVCFLDGQYDPYYNQYLWLLPENHHTCSRYFDRTICRRYTGSDDCEVQPRGMAKMEADSLVNVDAEQNVLKGSDFGIKTWKLVECGSQLPPCGTLKDRVDILPAAPIARLCDGLNATGTHKCTMASEPQKSHTECGLAGVADLQCRPWFNSLTEKK